MINTTNNSTDCDLPNKSDRKVDDHKVNDNKVILILKIVMVSGLLLIMLGIYFHMYSETIEAMGVKGIIISACCIAVGMIMSLPTKMYLTFVLVNYEQDVLDQARKEKREKKSARRPNKEA